MFEKRKIKRALKVFEGMESNAIAAYLQIKGVRGSPGTASSCPIANYLRGNGINDATVDRWNIHYNKSRLRVETPSNVANFIRNFDTYKYPNLRG